MTNSQILANMHASNRIAAACHAYAAGDNRTLARIWSTPPGLTAVEDDAAGDPSFARVVYSQDETHSTNKSGGQP